jgi:hypothetical protein
LSVWPLSRLIALSNSARYTELSAAAYHRILWGTCSLARKLSKNPHISTKQQLSLFEEAASESASAAPSWRFANEAHVDYIADEPVAAHLFHLQDLQDVTKDFVGYLQRELVLFMLGLAEQKLRARRESSFTLFMGAIPSLNTYAICLGSQSPEVREFFDVRLKALPGWYLWQEGLSSDFDPVFRYDSGCIIQYVTDETGGEAVVDGPERFGTGSVLYRRRWTAADTVGSTVSIYARRVS